MQRFLSIAMVLCLALTFSFEAHAKRFGGGKSFGSAPSHQTRQTQPSQPAATAPTASNAETTVRSCPFHLPGLMVPP